MLILASALKNADQMLRDIISVVDTSGDGRIQYEGGCSRTRGSAFQGEEEGGLDDMGESTPMAEPLCA